MANLDRVADVDRYNQQSVQKLVRAIAISGGEFSLILAHCNYGRLQQTIMQWLRDALSGQVHEITLERVDQTLLSATQHELNRCPIQPDALIVKGLDSLDELDQVLKATNQVRDEFRKLYSFPVVVWVNDEVLRRMIRLAPDFQSWATTIDFQLSTAQLVDALQTGENLMFQTILDQGVGRFLTNEAIFGSRYRQELMSALRDLQQRSYQLAPNLAASLDFVQGREAYSAGDLDKALRYYRSSLDYWQQTSDLKRQGCLLYSLGLLWRTSATRSRITHQQHCEAAESYFQRCIETFEQGQQPCYTARFINGLGEILHRLERWDALERIAKRALTLHQQYANRFRLARAHGFLSEVALAREQWHDAKHQAENALALLNQELPDDASPLTDSQQADLDWEQAFHQGWYLLSLARSQLKLGQEAEAVAALEQARAETKPEYDPELFICILNLLRQVYFDQGQFLTAFQIRQQRRAIEYQFGFRAFLGASRLEPKQQVTNPAIAITDHHRLLSQEISASGRQSDIDHLVERIARNDYRLTVVHGQSGVGKSSILQAGLVPTLKQTTLGMRDVLPVLQQTYADWLPGLSQSLTEALTEKRAPSLLSRSLTNSQDLIQQLSDNNDSNLITVLIFDQFEEFFFGCKDLAQRQQFYQFLKQCFNIPYVKVIVAIREDYLHCLLEITRFTSFEVINNNILDKSVLYRLGNFTCEEAKSIILHLTEKTPFSLELDLVDALVNDLAGHANEVNPIELQIVGAQLQTEEITTLDDYHQRGPKEKLVMRYLEAAIENCGPNNQRTAKQVLYALTDEQSTRPLKTLAEIAEDTEATFSDLKLVLNILVGAGLVFELPEASMRYYQLVHDYLVPFIRQGQEPELLNELKQTKAQLKQALHQEQHMRRRAEVAEIQALNSLSQALLLSHDQLGALVTSAKASRKLLDLEANISDLGSPSGFGSQGAPPSAIATETAARMQETLATIREANRLQGHGAMAFGVAISPDGCRIASASADHTLRIWGIDGQSIAVCRGHHDQVFNVCFHPSGTVIASSSGDRTVRLWRASSGAPLRTIKGHGDRVFGLAFSPDGDTLATACEDGTIRLWDQEGNWLSAFRRGARIYGLTFSPNGEAIASACEGGKIRLWSRDGTLLRDIKGHDEAVFSVSYSPDGHYFASASADGLIKLWNKNGELVRILQRLGTMAFCVSFSPDSQMLALTSADGGVRLCTIRGELIQTFRGHIGKVFGVSFSPDGRLLASTGEDKTVRLWNLNELGPHVTQGHRGRRILSACLNPDARMIASAGEDGTIKVWHLSGQLIKTFHGHESIVRSVCFSPDGTLLASASNDRTVKLWRLNGGLLQTLLGHYAGVRDVCFSPEGCELVSAGNDRTLRLWTLEGKLMRAYYGHNARIMSVCFSPDGNLLAAASARNVFLWRRDGALLQVLQGHSARVFSVCFSPDGQLLASAGADKTIRLWTREGQPLKILRGHDGSIRGLCFSPNGEQLASYGTDRTVRLWSLDGTLLDTQKGHLTTVCYAGFTPDSQTLISVAENKQVKGWTIPSFYPMPREEAGDRTSLDAVLDPPSAQPSANQLPADLPSLLAQSCQWLHPYLKHNPNVSESDRQICEGIDFETHQS